jgi:glycosyltransferase involved in cell wall biosynthesis
VVLISNSEFGYRVLPYLRHSSPETAFADYCHSETEDWYHGGYPRLSIEYRDVLDLTLTSSQHLKRWMVDRGADPERVDVCYANVDADAMRRDPSKGRELRMKLGIPNHAKVACFIGRVSAEKRPDVLLEAFARVLANGVDAHLIVAGGGPQLGQLQRRVLRKRLSRRVHLLGDLRHEDVASVLGASDLSVLPSCVEGIALTLYEAMASGLPVVAADIGGQSELVTTDVGLLVSPADEDQIGAFAAALERLFSDDELCRRMGRAARERIEEHFRIEQFGERLVQLLNRACELRAEGEHGSLLEGVVRSTTTEAVELARIGQIVNQQWRVQSRSALVREGYFVAQRLGRPSYLWLTAHGVSWLPQVRDAIRYAALGE